MSVVNFLEKYEARQGCYELDHGRREYTREFQVQVNALADNANTIITYALANGLVMGVTSYSGDVGALIDKIDAKQDSSDTSRLQWICTVHYSSRLCPPEVQQQDPISRPPKWVFGVSKYEQSLTQDLNGNPIVNSACMPFSTPLTVQVSQPTIEITINRATYDYTLVNSFGRNSPGATPPFSHIALFVRLESDAR
jgi:hypothetical protein